MNCCKNCGQHDFIKMGDIYVCRCCHQQYRKDELEDDDVLQDELAIINNSFKKQKDLISLTPRAKQDDLNDKIDKMEDLANRSDEALKSIADNKITDAVKDVLKELGIDSDSMSTSLSKLKDEINESLHKEILLMSDEIISKLPLKADANDNVISELAKDYTALDLIKRAKDNNPDSFVAPVAMIRKSVEALFKQCKSLVPVYENYYIEYEEAKDLYRELQESDAYKQNPKYIDGFLKNTLTGLGLKPLGEDDKIENYQRMIDNKLHVKVDIPFRFFVAGVKPNKIIKAYKNWRICNLFIHKGGFETLNNFDKYLINYDTWEHATREQMINMLTNIYNSFKSMGVEMIGDK